MKCFLMCSPRQILFRLSSQRGWEANVAGVDEKRNSYRVVVGKPERKKDLRQYKNIKEGRRA